jgi:hypothetical protein
MADQPQIAKRAHWPWLALASGLLLVMGYGVSTGPSYRLLRRGRIQQQTFSLVYRPVISAAKSSRTFERILYKYLLLWYSDQEELDRSFKQLKQPAEKPGQRENEAR